MITTLLKLQKSDMALAINMLNKLNNMGVLKDKEAKAAITRLKGSVEVAVLNKYVPLLEDLKTIVNKL